MEKVQSLPNGKSMKVYPPHNGLRLWIMLLLVGVTFNMLAQNRQINGTVIDQSGEPMIGATVKISGTNIATATDIDGRFTLNAPAQGSIEVTYIGYSPVKTKLTSATNYDITMIEDASALDEVVVVGYGTQKKSTLTGAVSQIDNKQLVATKTQDTKNMLTGKIPGVRVTQNTSEPGEFGQGNFDIRGYGGSPLIVVDGVPRGNLERIDPNDIESISVLKDASAAIYGVRAANGVILVTTKRGKEGKAKVEYSMYYGIQKPSEVLTPVGAIERMTLFNEKSMRSLTDPRLTYSDEQFAPYYDGTAVSTDWYDAVIRNTAPQQSHNIAISGGNKQYDYYVNFGYMSQDGFWKSGSMNYNRYNVRSNISAELLEGLRVSARLSGTIDNRNRPYTESWEVFKSLWCQVPDMPVYANNTPNYYSKPLTEILNPVASTDSDVSGFKKNTNKIITTNFEATYDLPWVKGLKLRGLFSYDNTIADNSSYRLAYDEYNYDAANDTYVAVTRNNPTNLQRYYGNSWTRLWQAGVNYDNTFGDHTVGAMLLWEESYSKGDNISAARNFSIYLPYLFAGDDTDQVGTANASGITELANKSLIGRFNYTYAGKYMAEFAFRHDGSSKFPSNKRWGFFPSASVGWRISEEKFLKENLDFLNNLKFRFSWGKMGDDGALAYQYVTGYDYPNTSGALFNNYPKGYVFGGSVQNSLGFRAAPNENITWYTVKTMNFGIDADVLNNRLGLTFELFQRDRDGLLASRVGNIPGSFGAAMSQENLNSDRTRGIELELRHFNRVGDFSYSVSGNVSYTRSQYRYVERKPSGNSYENWNDRNNCDRYNDIWFGWGAAGRYENFDQIANSSVFTGNSTLPGDYIYEDWNGDGTIDDMDRYPIATTLSASGTDFSQFQNKRNYPLMNFGLNLTGAWKGIDVSMTFQGSAMSYIAYGEQLSAPLQFNGNALELFLDRWHPADPKQDPYDPSAQWISGYYSYGGTTPDANSEFAIQKGDYLRLKTAEIGYTLPPLKMSKYIGISSLRVYVNAYNLLTFTKVKGVDPEKPANLYGYMYPLNKTFNFGLSLSF